MTKKILLMDPDGLVRDSMSLFLEDMGFYVKTSSSAKNALQSLSEGKYDVIICAQYMPDMDGLDFLRYIRKTCPDTMKILESDFDSNLDFFDEARMAGVSKIIHKPFTVLDVQEMVSRLH
jgi:CheY-like chemotaxis protein